MFPDCSCMICLACTVQYPQGCLLLLPGLRPSYCSSVGASFGLLIVTKFPILFGVLLSSQKDCSATERNVTGSLLPAFYFTSLVMKKV